MNPAIALRQQLAQISDIQAALDALRTDISLRLKETQQCTDAHDMATVAATGTSLRSGLLSVS